MNDSTESDTASTPSPNPPLQSLRGKPAPDDLAPSLAVAGELSAEIINDFDSLLVPHLETLAEDQLDNRIVRLCRRRELDPHQMARIIKASRFLFRHGAANNTTAEQLEADLRLLCPGLSGFSEKLVATYTRVIPDLRKEILVNALQAHGNVLSGIEWRIDTIGSSNMGLELNTPVALLTMHYQDRRQTGSFTIQLLPEMVSQLRDLCSELLNR